MVVKERNNLMLTLDLVVNYEANVTHKGNLAKIKYFSLYKMEHIPPLLLQF